MFTSTRRPDHATVELFQPILVFRYTLVDQQNSAKIQSLSQLLIFNIYVQLLVELPLNNETKKHFKVTKVKKTYVNNWPRHCSLI